MRIASAAKLITSKATSKTGVDHSYVMKTSDKKLSMPCDDSNDCKLCCLEVKDNDKALLCSRCKKWVHVSGFVFSSLDVATLNNR